MTKVPDPVAAEVALGLESRAAEWLKAAKEARRKKEHEAAVEFEEQAFALRRLAAAYRAGKIQPS